MDAEQSVGGTQVIVVTGCQVLKVRLKICLSARSGYNSNG